MIVLCCGSRNADTLGEIVEHYVLILLHTSLKFNYVKFYTNKNHNWRASKVSKPLSGLFNRESLYTY